MAEKNIRFIDKQGNKLYPQTRVSNLVDNEGRIVDFSKFITAEQLQNAIAGVETLQIIPVESLPSTTEAKAKAIYLVPATTSDSGNLFLEYMLINGAWELVGSAGIDLSGYVTTEELTESYYDKEAIDAKLETAGSITYEELT